MKNSKSLLTIFIITLCFSLVLASTGALFVIAERFFPVAVKSMKDDLLFIGVDKRLCAYSLNEGASYLSFSSLLSDERTELNNSLVLISAKHPICDSLDFSSVCEYKSSDVYFDYCAHEAYRSLADHISKKFNTKLYIMSAFRSEEEQADIYNEQGPDTAQKPGESEHQSGLALDVYVSGYAGASFFKTDVGKYVNSFCSNYGFIIRYPSEAKDVTGIDFEPWHIRYVGRPHSDIIALNSITLEEYLDSLIIDNYYSIGNYVILKTDGSHPIGIPEQYEALTVSPDNCGNYVLTFKLYDKG